ncbi:4Fe-4S dicluster domain-containing protein [Saccharolobus caldissimus]|uniref:4Fe-4S ferredoxin-type domain-containing protein n=1 Tax=Saccharolobus caldissimus TaxID=1702097 RepID=A0AAQ4CWK8_9CREN|nr:4Fe-4S dicluster domain-containing protein [Saccharolobus caldissimus]BDC00190.1 hypothetical protein SACC_32060 [Saccharolobus caldissimus]
MYEDFYRILKPTKISDIKVNNIIKYKDGIVIKEGSTPRYEYFRGIEGENIVDFIGYTGIEDLGDKIKVKAGTKWLDILRNYNIEFWSNLDFTIGGSVFFNDPISGFNEFGKIKDRVEVDGFINGEFYSGKYKGGIVINVYLKKENKEIIYERFDGNLNDLITIIKNWYSTRIPVFRDVSIVKKDKESYILVSYPKIRERLVIDLIRDFSIEKNPIYEYMNYEYWYLGYIPINDINNIIKQFEAADFSILRFRKDEIAFSLYSNKPLNPILNALEYSTVEGNNLFSGCILCGKCIDVCPYGKQVNDVFHTPLGFYTISYFEKENELANCHMCGLCESVCPVTLNITESLKRNSKLNEIRPKNVINIPNKIFTSVLLITPLSEELEDQIIKSIIYLRKKGKKIGILYLNIDFTKLIKDELNISELEKIKEIYVVTPEEYFYLQKLRKKTLVDIYHVQLLAMDELKLDKSKLHIPCLLRGEVSLSELVCSNIFLNILNSKDNIRKINKEITLCPLTAKELKIKTPLDLLGIDINENYIENIIKKVNKEINNIRDIEEDLNWYNNIDDNIIYEIYSNIIDNVVKDEKLENLLLIYFKLNKIDGIGDNIKKILTEKIEKIIFS